MKVELTLTDTVDIAVGLEQIAREYEKMIRGLPTDSEQVVWAQSRIKRYKELADKVTYASQSPVL